MVCVWVGVIQSATTCVESEDKFVEFVLSFPSNEFQESN